jgi:hypothetical protein
MVYKKYIKRDGKVFGPYLYHNIKKDGRVITQYLGRHDPNHHEEKKSNLFGTSKQPSKKFLFVAGFLTVLIIFLSVNLLFLLQFLPSGKVSMDIQSTYSQGGLISGDIKLVLKHGELFPANSKLIVNDSGQISEYSLRDLVSNSLVNGTFFIENKEIIGNGEGYGVKGQKEVFPNVTFSFRIINIPTENITPVVSPNISEEGNQTTPNEFTQQPNNNGDGKNNIPSEQTPIENGANTPGESTPTEPSANSETSPAETTTTESSSTPSTETSSSSSESSSSSTTSESSSITGGIISEEDQNLLQGVVSKNNPFNYQVSDGQIIEVVYSTHPVSFKQDGNSISVTTDYSEFENGFGKDYLTNDVYSIPISLSNLGIQAKPGTLKVSFVYQDNEVISSTKVIRIVGINESIFNETNLTILNITNVTAENITNMTKSERIKFILDNKKFKVDQKVVSKLLESDEKVKVILRKQKGYEFIMVDANTLASVDNVDSIVLDQPVSLFLTESENIIRSSQTRSTFGLSGKGKGVCILDTGIDSSVITNYKKGYDFLNNDSDPSDDNGHGTEVAYIIQTIAPAADIYAAKVIDANGNGYESGVLQGLQWCMDQNVNIISLSIGAGSYSGYCDSEVVADFANTAVNNGIVVVAATGNGGSVTLASPSCSSKVLRVAATDKQDNIASFSNVNYFTDLFAPGVGIQTKTIGGGYTTVSGTSMSAPMVASGAALLLEHENLNTSQLAYRLKSTGKPILFTGDKTVNISRLDVYNAIINNATMIPYGYSVNQTIGNQSNFTTFAQTLYNVTNYTVCVNANLNPLACAYFGSVNISEDKLNASSWLEANGCGINYLNTLPFGINNTDTGSFTLSYESNNLILCTSGATTTGWKIVSASVQSGSTQYQLFVCPNNYYGTCINWMVLNVSGYNLDSSSSLCTSNGYNWLSGSIGTYTPCCGGDLYGRDTWNGNSAANGCCCNGGVIGVSLNGFCSTNNNWCSSSAGTYCTSSGVVFQGKTLASPMICNPSCAGYSGLNYLCDNNSDGKIEGICAKNTLYLDACVGPAVDFDGANYNFLTSFGYPCDNNVSDPLNNMGFVAEGIDASDGAKAICTKGEVCNNGGANQYKSSCSLCDLTNTSAPSGRACDDNVVNPGIGFTPTGICGYNGANPQCLNGTVIIRIDVSNKFTLGCDSSGSVCDSNGGTSFSATGACCSSSCTSTGSVATGGSCCGNNNLCQTGNICNPSTSTCKKVNGQICSNDGDCNSSNCDADISGTLRCHANANNCVIDASGAETLNGGNNCSTGTQWKNCNNAVWSSPTTCNSGSWCTSQYQMNVTSGTCNNGNCDSGSTSFVTTGKVCQGGSNVNPSGSSTCGLASTQACNCSIWRDCNVNSCSSAEYYVGFNNVGACDNSYWQSKGTIWNTPVGNRISVTSASVTCSVDSNFCDSIDNCFGVARYDGMICNGTGSCNIPSNVIGCCQGSNCSSSWQYCNSTTYSCQDVRSITCAKRVDAGFNYVLQINAEDLWNQCSPFLNSCSNQYTRTGGNGNCSGGSYACDSTSNSSFVNLGQVCQGGSSIPVSGNSNCGTGAQNCYCNNSWYQCSVVNSCTYNRYYVGFNNGLTCISTGQVLRDSNVPNPFDTYRCFTNDPTAYEYYWSIMDTNTCNGAYQCTNSQYFNGAYNNGGFGFYTQGYCGSGICNRSGWDITGDGNSSQAACECRIAGIQANCDPGETACWQNNATSSMKCCQGGESVSDYTGASASACVNGVYRNDSNAYGLVCDSNLGSTKCNGASCFNQTGNIISFGTGLLGNCCGNDPGENFINSSMGGTNYKACCNDTTNCAGPLRCYNNSEEYAGSYKCVSGTWYPLTVYNTCTPLFNGSILVINQTVSCQNNILIVKSLNVTSGGSLTLTNSTLLTGPTIVASGGVFTSVNSKYTIVQNDNLTISGLYVLDSSTLKLNGTSSGGVGINVTSTGQMVINNSANITNGDNSNANYFFIVNNGAKFNMTDSYLSNAGWGANQGQKGLEINTSNILIRNSSFSQNYNAITIYGTSSSLIEGNTIGNITNYGIDFINSSNNVIRYNTINSYPTRYFINSGIALEQNSYSNLVYSNNITLNGVIGVGIYINSNSKNNIVYLNNVATFTYSGSGLWIRAGSDNNSIYGNVINANNRTSYGVMIYGSKYTNFYSNNITSIGDNSSVLYLQSAAINNTFYNNLINSTGTSLFISGSGGDSYGNLFVDNTVVSGSILDVNVTDNAYNNIFRNVNFSISKAFVNTGNNNLTVQWYLYVNVTGSQGLPISGASVSALDYFSGLSFIDTTNSSGFTSKQNVTEYLQNSSGIVSYSNYTLNSASFGYADSRQFNMSLYKNGVINVNLISTTPWIYFASPTPDNNSFVRSNWIYVNTSIGDLESPSNLTGLINLNNSLVGWWRFNEGNGNTSQDFSGRGNNASFNPNAWGEGKFGAGLNVSGRTYSANVSASVPDPGLGSYTVSFWARSLIEDAGSLVISKGFYNINMTGWRWRVGGDYKMYFQVGDGLSGGRPTDYIEATELNPSNDNQWHNFVGIVDRSLPTNYIKLYKDGVFQQQNEIRFQSGSINATGHNLFIGCGDGGNNDPTNRFNGSTDDIQIWNRALTPDEINAEYNAGVSKLFSNYTNLISGNYNYTAYVQDVTGNVNQTETRILLFKEIPVVSNVILNSTSGQNSTSDNISVYYNTTDSTTVISDWRVNGSSIAVLNLPFDTNISSNAAKAIKDYSTFGNNGTLGNSTLGTQPIWNASGKIGGAYEFDGVGDFINCTNSSSLNLNGSMAIEVWIRPAMSHETTGNNYGVLAKATNPRWSWQLRFGGADGGGTNTDRLGFQFNNNTNDQAVPGAWVNVDRNLVSGQWYHIVGTYNGTHAKIYLNGVLNDTKPVNRIQTSVAPLVIGHEGWNNFFNGTIDDVRIYNRSLSAEQINILYQTGLSGKYPETISDKETFTGDVWSDALTPNDFYGDGVTVLSNNLTITNVIPVINLQVSPTVAYTKDDLNCTFNVSDDSPRLDVTVIWSKDGLSVFNKTFTNYATGSINFLSLPHIYTNNNRNMTCNVSVIDDNYFVSAINSTVIQKYPTVLNIVNDTVSAMNQQIKFTANYSSNQTGEIKRVIWNNRSNQPSIDEMYMVRFADLDNDGVNDEVVALARNSSSSYNYYLIGFSSSGSILWTSNPIGVGALNAFQILVGNFNNDGYNDSIAVCTAGSGISMYDKLGNLKWQSNAFGLNYCYSMISLDVNNDGNSEIFGDLTNGLTSNITIFYGNGTILWNLPAEPGFSVAYDLAVGDFDHDGLKNDVAVSYHNPTLGIDLINKTGGLIRTISWNVGKDSIEAINLDGDNYDELFAGTRYNAGIHAYDDNGAQLWSLVLGKDDIEMATADINNDSRDDLIFGDSRADSSGYTSSLFAYNNSNSSPVKLWNVTLNNDYSTLFSMYTGDINDGGQKEIVSTWSDSKAYVVGNNGNLLFILNMNGTAGNVSSGDVEVTGKHVAVDIGDINNDGVNDIAISSKDGNVYLIQEVFCNITFNDSVSSNMTWNSATSLWEFNRSFSSAGQYKYNVTCIKGGYISQTQGSLLNISQNTPPVVTLISPSDNATTTNRSQNFTWSGFDAEGDPLNYEFNITLYDNGAPGRICSDSRNVIATGNFTIDPYLKCLFDDGYYYNWTVRANDGHVYGAWATPRRLNVQSMVSITLLNRTVSFGTVLPDDFNDTVDNAPTPLLLENDGNCIVNVSLNASNLWLTSPNPSGNFTYKIDNYSGEPGSFNWNLSRTFWTPVPANTSLQMAIAFFNWSNAADTAEIDFYIHVPRLEPAGTRTSWIVFKADLSE